MQVGRSLFLTCSTLSKPISCPLERKNKALDLPHLHDDAFGTSSICSFHSSKALSVSFPSAKSKQKE